MSAERPLRVLVAGGGIAALELLLAVRAAAGDRCALTLITPDPSLRYRPESVAEPFSGRRARAIPWMPIARALGVELIDGRVHSVLAETEVVLDDERRIGFDELVIAAGAHQVDGVAHASTFRPEAADELHWVIDELEQEETESLVLVAPRRCGWTLPLYELALMAAARVTAACGDPGRITVVTYEHAPLEAFRGPGSDAVAQLLAKARVHLVTGHEVTRYDGERLELHPHASLPAGRVVALPELVGPRIHGLPLDGHGFVRVDEQFAVEEREHVHAIGDAASFALKQGGLATQQADAVASLIAARAGSSHPVHPFEPRLRAILWTGADPLYLTATAIGAETVASAVSKRCPWWPVEKIAAVHAAPFLSDVEELGTVAAVSRLAAAGSTPAATPVIHAAAGDPGVELLARDA